VFFISEPSTDTCVIKRTKELGMLSIPGAFTPTEIMTAYNAGAEYIKLFTITKEDIGYLKNITAPISHVPLICTGGVNPDTVELFLKNGVVALGTGASILKKELIESENYPRLPVLQNFI
jgi:2-dehydro-3-deoxyphosphogluconate aldolase/(4S)-4-hydroxy-2-oxoglutarate aldolase